MNRVIFISLFAITIPLLGQTPPAAAPAREPAAATSSPASDVSRLSPEEKQELARLVKQAFDALPSEENREVNSIYSRLSQREPTTPEQMARFKVLFHKGAVLLSDEQQQRLTSLLAIRSFQPRRHCLSQPYGKRAALCRPRLQCQIRRATMCAMPASGKLKTSGVSIHPAAAAAIRRAFGLMRAAQGHLRWWPARTPFEVCVGAILTQNTQWRNVMRALANLEAAGVMEAEALLGIPEAQLAGLLRPAGCCNVKGPPAPRFSSHPGSRPRRLALPPFFRTAPGRAGAAFGHPWDRPGNGRQHAALRGGAAQLCDRRLHAADFHAAPLGWGRGLV